MLLDNWLDEITKYIRPLNFGRGNTNHDVRHVMPGRIHCHKYHGIMRQLDLTSVCLYDIVLSTYGTVAADLARNRGLLNQIHWYRIVLDEGESFRDPFFVNRNLLTKLGSPYNQELVDQAVPCNPSALSPKPLVHDRHTNPEFLGRPWSPCPIHSAAESRRPVQIPKTYRWRYQSRRTTHHFELRKSKDSTVRGLHSKTKHIIGASWNRVRGMQACFESGRKNSIQRSGSRVSHSY